MDALIIDGAQGEGGGQILRTALGLSVATGRPFAISNIRAGRRRPGLLRQHLSAVRMAAAVGRAAVTGAELGATALTFRPSGIFAGSHHANIGSAGSAMLVLQTVLPALLLADQPSQLIIEGGTHNPAAPPYDFVARTFLPLLARMGARVQLTLQRPGFYPAGGGRVVAQIEPAPLSPLQLQLIDRGPLRSLRARAVVSGIAPRVGHRELGVLKKRLGLEREQLILEELSDPQGPGNVVMVEAECDALTEIFTSFGERGVSAETVAEQAADQACAWLAHGFPVGEFLADQLLVPLALAGGGCFRTGPLSSHALTNAAVVQRFLPVRITTEPLPDSTTPAAAAGVEVRICRSSAAESGAAPKS